MVDPHSGVGGDVHAAARHHRRERGAASIREDLGASFTDLQWVVDAYALTLAALVLTAGSLADRLGRRRVFAAGLVIFSAASLLCALAPDPTFLNLARAVQGVGGAVMFAVSLALIAQEFAAGRERGMAMGAYGATIGVAVAIGPLVGGALTDSLGWESIFYLNVPIGIGGARDHLAQAAREPRPERDPRRLGRRRDVQRRAVPARAGARARQRRGLGQHPDRVAVRRRGGAAGRLRRRSSGASASRCCRSGCSSGPLHRRPARRVRGLGLDLRAVPLPDALPAELPRPLAARGGPALSADHGGELLRRAGRRRAAVAGAGRA